APPEDRAGAGIQLDRSGRPARRSEGAAREGSRRHFHFRELRGYLSAAHREAGRRPGSARRGVRPGRAFRLDHGGSRARHATGAEALRAGVPREARRLVLPHRDAGRNPRGRRALRRDLQEDPPGRRGPHFSDVANRPRRNASRPVPERALRPRRAAPRPAGSLEGGKAPMMGWLTDWLPRFVARAPATIRTKLLAAFLSIVVLLITVGAVGLQVLTRVERHAEEMVTLQRKIAAYRQLQHDTTAQLYSVTSALLIQE